MFWRVTDSFSRRPCVLYNNGTPNIMPFSGPLTICIERLPKQLHPFKFTLILSLPYILREENSRSGGVQPWSTHALKHAPNCDNTVVSETVVKIRKNINGSDISGCALLISGAICSEGPLGEPCPGSIRQKAEGRCVVVTQAFPLGRSEPTIA